MQWTPHYSGKLKPSKPKQTKHTREQTGVYLLTQKSTLEPGIKVQPDTLQTNVWKQTTNRKMPLTIKVVKNVMKKSYNVYLSIETSGMIFITGTYTAL